MKFDSQKINRYIIFLAYSMATLILINGGFAFWQMNQVKDEFYDVANWDLPLVVQLSPLIDRQIEQAGLMEKMLQPGVFQKNAVVNSLKKNFMDSGREFKGTLEKIKAFIGQRLEAGRKDTRFKMNGLLQLLGRIEDIHGRYETGILSLIETVRAGGKGFDSDKFALLFNLKKAFFTESEKDMRRILLELRGEVQNLTQESARAVERREDRVIQGVVFFTLFTYLLATLLLFMIYQVIQSRDKAVEEITYYATHDPLTKLINRRYFFVRLDEAIKAARRHKSHLSLCVCDLDHFKVVNDNRGHLAGDKVLTGFGEILNNEKRAEDIAGRFGGDEFVICFPNTQAKDTVHLLERVRQAFANKSFRNGTGKPFNVTATFGVADIDPENPDPESLVAAADKALYKAKENGRNQIACS